MCTLCMTSWFRVYVCVRRQTLILAFWVAKYRRSTRLVRRAMALLNVTSCAERYTAACIFVSGCIFECHYLVSECMIRNRFKNTFTVYERYQTSYMD
jgi:hypothetical protein